MDYGLEMKPHTLISVLMFIAILIPLTSTAALAEDIEFKSYDVFLRNRECPCYGGTLRIAIAGEPTTLNWWVAASSWSRFVLMPIYNRLLRIINGTIVMEVAKRLWWSENRSVLYIEIRSGILWHDGKPLTARDVAFTINTLARYRWTYLHGYFTSVKKAIAINDTLVEVVFREPDAGFVLNALTKMCILPEHIWKPLFDELGDNVAKYSPRIEDLIGSGPFKIVKYVPGQFVEYRAFDMYWQGRPCIDRLVIVFIKSSTAGLLALEKGDIDAYLGYVDPEAALKLENVSSIRVAKVLSDIVFYWGFNTEKWPFNISEFRRALAYAIDRQKIIEVALHGYGIPASPGVVPSIGVNSIWYNPHVANAIRYDPNEAARILDSLGFRDIDGDGWRETPSGKHFCIDIYVPSYDTARIRAAELIRSYLSKIPGGGICVNIRVTDWSKLWPLIRSGAVDSFILGSAPGTDISWLYRRFHCPPQGSGNWARYCNPVIDNLTEALREVFDYSKRRDIAWRIQEVLAKELPIVPLYHRIYLIPYRVDNVKGWFVAANEWPVNWITLLRVYSSQCLYTATTNKNEFELPISIAIVIAIAVAIGAILFVVARARRS